MARKSQQEENRIDFMDYLDKQVKFKKSIGKIRTSEIYESLWKKLHNWLNGQKLYFDEVTGDKMQEFEAYMKSQGNCLNTISAYFRPLRATYNKAIDEELIEAPKTSPFKRVYIGNEKTIKRAIPISRIKYIANMDFNAIPGLHKSTKKSMEYARDMFMFSFCMRGMSFVDMAYLKKKDLKNGHITYRRKKTGQLLNVEWTRQMQNIVDKYKFNATGYLLPIILREDGTERRQYQNQMMKVNRHLKEVANLINLTMPLSLYCSRHSWATIARGKDIPLSVISEGLGHDSEATTQIYLDSIKSSEVDKANRKILKDL